MFDTLKRVLIGQPIASSEEHQHRLIKLVALAVFSSDAISSTAYATEEILHVLVPVAAAEALGYLIPISLVVMGLLAVVITSYRQVIFAYPTGGGSYVVAKNNLGETPSLVAGASLLVDYEHFVVVAVGTVNKAVLNAITYARSLAPDRLVAVSVVGDAEEQEAVQKAWAEHSIVIELHTIYSPYREPTEPFMRYLDEQRRPGATTTSSPLSSPSSSPAWAPSGFTTRARCSSSSPFSTGLTGSPCRSPSTST
ncbi:MAG: hypothetical protein ACRD29_23615 [Acidimicrobiales bacterium]